MTDIRNAPDGALSGNFTGTRGNFIRRVAAAGASSEPVG